jgi:hypothetical protein
MKNLNIEEIELLRRQGLLADIRNKLGNLSNIQQLIELYFSTGQTQKMKAEIGSLLKKEGGDIKESIEHILAALEYVYTLPKEEIEKIIKGEAQIKREEMRERNNT